MKIISQSVQRGYTLIELSIGLAVTSLVIGSVVMGVEKMLKSFAVNRTISQIATSVEKIKLTIVRDPDAKFVTQANFTAGVNNAFASQVVDNGGTETAKVYTALGYQVYLNNKDTKPWGTYTNGSVGYLVDDQTFIVNLSGVEPTTCFDLASGLEGIANGVYLVANANDITLGLATGQFINFKTPNKDFNVSLARKSCGANFNNNLIFQIRK
jgi:prepilin-type N-terminal cleavage/methylation domain-containing protein